MLRTYLQLLCVCEEVGTFWSIENPASSRLWKTPEIHRLDSRPGTETAIVDQCSFGLNDPAREASYKKRTIFLGTLPDLHK